MDFRSSGGIEFEVRDTGIVSTVPMDNGVSVPRGTNMGPWSCQRIINSCVSTREHGSIRR